MASLSARLLGAGAEAKNDWAKAEASTALNFTGDAKFRRGVELAIGLSAMASADAGLARFVDATARGNAFAEATARLQLQLPLNLFEEFGLAVGAQADAQAAAGIEVGLGLLVGDFLDLIGADGANLALPFKVARLLLDEADIGGKFEVHVAAAAMAYASAQITGKIIGDAGFHYTADAGLGLAAGIGFSGGLDLGVKDFRRFLGRSVDLVVKTTIDQITALLPANLKDLTATVQAIAPVASASLRIAYEIGDYLAENDVRHDNQAAIDLSNHCVGVLLEEAQRYLFGRYLDAGLSSFKAIIDAGKVVEAEWDALFPQRKALADALYQMPDEPFQPTSENAVYWLDFVDRAVEFLAALPLSASDQVTRGVALLFCAVELLTEAIKNHINQATAYAFAMDVQTQTPTPRFPDQLDHDPPPQILKHINQAIGRGQQSSAHLDYADLLAYLVEDGAIAALREFVPEIDSYLAIFQRPGIAATLDEVLRTLLNNSQSFAKDSSGKIDPKTTLAALIGALDAFITDEIKQKLRPAVDPLITDENARLYFDEVLVSTILDVKSVVFPTILNWEKSSVDVSDFTEALAGVLTTMLGRSLVLVADGFLAALQAEMAGACSHAADRLNADTFRFLGISESDDIKSLLVATLRAGGDVFGPLPKDTRDRLRHALYDCLTTLPATEEDQADFASQLASQFFVPNLASLFAFSNQLLAISQQRFERFVQLMLAAGGDFVGDVLQKIVAQLVDVVNQWAKKLEGVIQSVRDEIAGIENAISQLISDAQQALDQAEQQLNAFLAQLANANARASLRAKLSAALLSDALAELAANPIYASLPRPLKDVAKSALQLTIDGLTDGPFLDPVFNAVGAIAGDIEGVFADARSLNPYRPLAPQLLDLIASKVEDRLRDTLGNDGPHIDINFAIDIFGFTKQINLGRVDLPLGQLFALIRQTFQIVSAFGTSLENAAAALSDALAKQNALQAQNDTLEAKRADRDRLQQIKDEFNASPKEIAILSPLPTQVLDYAVNAQVRLSGVARSYLGLKKDEQQRVFIFLNGTLIDLKTVAVSTDETATDAAVQAATVSPLANLRPPQLLPLQGVASSSAPVIRRSVAKDKSGGTVVSTSLANVLPGRLPDAAQIARFSQSLPPGPTLSWRIDPDGLYVGANSLAVVIVDPNGKQYQQAVSFVVADAPKNDPGGARLPPREGVDRLTKPTRTANGLDLHFNPALVGDALQNAVKSIADQSALHFGR